MVSISLTDIKVTYPGNLKRYEQKMRSRLLKALAFSGKRDKGNSRIWALKGVSLRLHAGDIAGIIGENGAGKTTLLRVIARLIKPDSGTVDISGTVSSVFSLGAGFIPDLTGRENIHLVGSLYGFSRKEISQIEGSIIDFSELTAAIDRPIKTYSAGMRARLGFSIVTSLDSKIIVLDEALSAGDMKFRQKAGNLIERFFKEDKILVVVSHAQRVIREYCNKAYYIHEGQIAAEGTTQDVCDIYEDYGSASRRP
jgi:ABC-type polysaccharide/polyol phosphate transport system ATPase subunit